MPDLAAMMGAISLARDNRHGEAVTGLQRILRRNPALADGWNQLAMSLEALGRYEESIAAYRLEKSGCAWQPCSSACAATTRRWHTPAWERRPTSAERTS
jgi:predicted Zn-dependent protease